MTEWEAGLINSIAYNSDTGVLVWKIKASAHVFPGDVAGTVNNSGYRMVIYRKKHASAHRLAWFLHYRKWPQDQIDHINHDRTDNRISNLRDVTCFINQQNRAVQPKSGKVGVCWDKDAKKWRIYYKCKYGGVYKNLADAVKARESIEALNDQ